MSNPNGGNAWDRIKKHMQTPKNSGPEHLVQASGQIAIHVVHNGDMCRA